MKINSKLKILSLFLCGIIIAGSLSLPLNQAVYATGVSEETTESTTDGNSENEGKLEDAAPFQDVDKPESAVEVETEGKLEDDAPLQDIDATATTETTGEYELAIFDWEQYYDASTGQIDGNRFTTPTDGMYALEMSAKVFEEFDDSCYIYIEESEHKDKKIRIDLYPDENFEKTVYLPAGYYQVVESGATQSPTLSFKVTAVGVSLNNETDSAQISIILNNVANIDKTELGEWYDKTTSAESQNINNKIYGVEALNGIQSNISGVLYYSTTHKGPQKTQMVEKEVQVVKDGQTITEIQQVEEIYYEDAGLGYVTPCGNAIASTDIVLLICKEGVVGQAEFKVSYDGGQTFIARYATGDEVFDANINLTYNFYTLNDTDEFTEGDRFEFRSIESFEVKNSESSEKTRISCVGHPTSNHELEITVLSSGGRGISRVKVFDAKGNMETKTYLIPSDGIMVLDDNLTVYFENVDGYVKGVNYKILITSHDTTINYTPIIALCIILVVLLFMALFWLLLKKEKKGDYIVHTYKWKQDESAYLK